MLNSFKEFMEEFNSSKAMQDDFKAFSAAIDLEKEMNGLTETEATEKVSSYWYFGDMLANRRLELVEQAKQSLNNPALTEGEKAALEKNLTIIDF